MKKFRLYMNKTFNWKLVILNGLGFVTFDEQLAFTYKQLKIKLHKSYNYS